MRELYRKCQRWACAHHKAFRYTHHSTHLTYLGLVVAHGPYTYAAGALLLLSLVMLILHMETES